MFTVVFRFGLKVQCVAFVYDAFYLFQVLAGIMTTPGHDEARTWVRTRDDGPGGRGRHAKGPEL